jgi:hypothetical protein
VATYFPSTLDAGQAESIHVAGGDQLSGYEIRLRAVQVYRVRGVLVNETGEPVSKARVHLSQSTPSLGFANGALANGVRRYSIWPLTWITPAAEVTSGDGTFEFPAVPDGKWVLDAETQEEQSNALRGHTTIFIDHRDLAGTDVRLSKSFPLTVQVEVEGLPAGDPSAPMVTLNPVEGQQPVFAIGNTEVEIYPGQYQIGAPPRGYYFVSASVGGRHVPGSTLDLRSDSPPLHIVFKQATSSVRGIVDGRCGGLLIWPQQPGDYTTIHQVPCSPSGRFEIDHLQPEDYYIAAFDRVEGLD